MAVKSTTKDDPKQFDRFVEMAAALGCNEDKDQFEAKLGTIAKAKPSPPKAKVAVPGKG